MKITKLSGIKDKIKTWLDICNHLGIDSVKSLPYENPKDKTERFINASFKISKLSEVLNNGTILDFTNRNQSKYLPYFKKEPFGWVVGSYSHWYYHSSTGFGSFYKTSDLAMYAGKQFLNEIYLDYLPE